jgi:hypothetical protein
MLRIVVDVPRNDQKAENVLLAYAETIAGRPVAERDYDNPTTRLTATVPAYYLQDTVEELLEVEGAELIDVDILNEVA